MQKCRDFGISSSWQTKILELEGFSVKLSNVITVAEGPPWTRSELRRKQRNFFLKLDASLALPGPADQSDRRAAK
jgi:hypothetical protein